MVTHSSILAWEILRTEEPGWLQAKSELQLSYSVYIHIYIYIYICMYTGEGKDTPLQYSCLENPMDGGAC